MPRATGKARSATIARVLNIIDVLSLERGDEIARGLKEPRRGSALCVILRGAT